MSALPRIGLTTYREPAVFGVWNEPADLLPTTYADAIIAAGGAPMLLPPVDDGPQLSGLADAVLDGLDGLLLSGGADVDPARYDAAREDETGPARSDRDAWEIELVRGALRRDLPVLGVCRGMQLLAVALGGTLVQHLPDVVGNESHRPTVGVHGRHEVRLADGSRIAGIVGPVAQVATYHHQSVDRLPDAAVANGWTEDGTIEAFEVCEASWAIGVQWHPEVHDGMALFRAFIEASRAWGEEHPPGAVDRQPRPESAAGRAG
jgi:putative glutamine amidotransferase